MSNVLVSVVMITYKHEAFIEDAINGVLMQDSDFEVELIIADDNSPDQTEAIVKTFKNHKNSNWIKYTKHNTNKGMMPNFIWALGQAKGKYIALCEGDDYWTDPYKLQKQVDFLEINKKYVGHFGMIKRIRDDKFVDYFPNLHHEQAIDFNDLVNNWCLSIATLMFRKSSWENNIPFNTKYNIGDKILAFNLSKKGKFYFSNQVFANYRFHEGGVTSNSTINWNEETINYLIEFNKENKNMFDKYIINFILLKHNSKNRQSNLLEYTRNLIYISRLLIKINPYLWIANIKNII